jgi:hypothetical protein
VLETIELEEPGADVDVDAEEPNVLLTGGPASCFTNGGRTWSAERLDADVKVLNGNRYEHFSPTPESVSVDGRRLRIFVWSGYTKVAE